MSRKSAWRQFANETGGEYVVEGGLRLGPLRLFGSDRVVTTVKQWTVVLDTETESSYYGSTTYTRMAALYVSRDRFRFGLYRASFLSGLERHFLGMRDIEVGYPDFDRDFIVKGNDEAKVRALFASENIRHLFQTWDIHGFEFQINDVLIDNADSSSGLGFAELFFRVNEIIKDLEPLKFFHQLFAETLTQLCRIGSASEESPHAVL